jgi:NitT/TauT family transport system substrate-binding protein
MSRLTRVGALLGILGLAMLAMPGARAADKINVGYIPVDDFIPNFVAIEKGFYAKHGLDVKLVVIPLASNVPAALFSGSIQIGMSTTPIFMQARESGIDLAAFAGIARDKRSNPRLSLLARKGSGIKTAKDLEGKKIAVPGLNSLFDIALRKWIVMNGGDPKKVTFVEARMPLLTDVLRTGNVDAIAVLDPFRAKALADGTAEKVADYFTQMHDDQIMAFWIVARPWAEKNRKIVDAYKQAMAEAVAFAQSNREETKQIGTKYLKVPMSNSLPNWTTEVTADDLKYQADFQHELGFLKNPPDTSKAILK